ncbi:cation diffusion facilitator family transporter [Ornithinimicrobium sp. LYQ103]|uniref:cation diffusion facilitator family transporter n=1 Tax=Ornithinimicrobium sp. LYQ103 TaxID=3378796 RepID=UPI0038547319
MTSNPTHERSSSHDEDAPPHDHDDHAGHDHEHSSGLWGKVRHALTPHSHDHTEAIQTAQEASAVGIRAAWISLAGMGVTALLQIVIVALSGSIALLADTVHNLGHLATTIPLIIAFRIGRRSPTRRYSHGFRRAEDLVGLLIGLVIALSAALIIWESVRALVEPRGIAHLGWVMAAALVGAAGNEAVAIYRIRAGRRIGSAALIAEGQHARTDALTSLAVAVGVIGIWAGMPQLDAIIGLVIAAVILAVLVASMRSVVRRLMDGVDDGTLDRVETAAAAVPGVHEVTEARARWSGHRMEAEVTVFTEASLSLAGGHDLAQQVEAALVRTVPHLERAVVRVVPARPPAGTDPGQPAASAAVHD